MVAPKKAVKKPAPKKPVAKKVVKKPAPKKPAPRPQAQGGMIPGSQPGMAAPYYGNVPGSSSSIIDSISNGAVQPSVANGAASPPMTIEQWLGTDADYQNQLRMYASQLQNSVADATRQRGMAEGDYSTNLNRVNVQHGRDLTHVKEDYSGRGLLHSGMYGKALGQNEQDNNMNLMDLLRGKSNLIGNIDAQQQQFQQQTQQAQEQARIDSVRRRLLTMGNFGQGG